MQVNTQQQPLFDNQASPATAAVPTSAGEGDGGQQWTQQDLSEAAQQQFRLQQMQIMNWGTFNKLHVFDISARGHLLVGPSGSGKSTLLDAHSALMAPPNSEFNAAARGNDKVSRDRTLVTYIRGAWATNESEDGLIAAQYLRPDTTLSAVAEVYTNAVGQTLTLVGMWWIKGKSTLAKDVRHSFFVIERAFSLKELAFFMQADYNLRSFAQQLPEVKPFDTHAGFRERFKARLGIDHDLALRLLHRTQSSKNLGDINAFMRENMLDEPQTFRIAKELCEDFNTLAAAHRDVVQVREQQKLLSTGRNHHAQYQEHQAQVRRNDTLLGQLDHHREYLRYNLRGVLADQLKVTLEAVRQQVESLARKADGEEAELARLRKRRAGMDDGNVAGMQQQLKDKEALLRQVVRTRLKVAGWLQILGWTQPQDAASFGERLAEAAQMRQRGLEKDEDGREDALRGTMFEADKHLRELLEEVRSLELRTSNLPGELVQVRDRIAEALGVEPAVFPFGGELLDVPESSRRWQGALERLLAPMTRSFLVPESHYRDVVDWLESHHTGQHMLYLRMREHHRRNEEDARAPGRMLDTAPGSYGDWLRSELAQQYGSFACAETTEQFRAADRALSLQGQIKRGGTRHEKNDRSNLNNRRDWVMGFSNEQKKLELLEDIQTLQRTHGDAQSALNGLLDKRAKAQEKLNAAGELSQVVWEDVDEASVAAEMRRLERAIEEAEQAHPEIQELDAQVEAQNKKASDARGDHETQLRKRDEIAEQIAQLEQACARTSETQRTPPGDGDALEALFAGRGDTTLDNLDTRYEQVRGTLKDRRNAADRECVVAKGHLEEVLRTFRLQHKAAAADMGTTLVDWPDHERLLSKIEADDLPRFEERFFRLLNEQSDRHLAKLRQRIITEKDEIRGRMDIVNDALSQSEFNEGTYLRLENTARTLPEVTAFVGELRACLERNIRPDATREEREAQFDALNAIVQRLHSDKPEDERWKALVLDVRQHVEFVAKEYDLNGRVLDILQSGAGKSGGQRQKFAATCLAAALRYQLAGTGRALPQFCTVLMDEAFDKADSEFTAMILNIFNRFGFQMIMATPMKAVRTLEPFIGGAHVFSNRARNNSGALPIEYDMVQHRLVGLGSQPLEEPGGGDGESDPMEKRRHAGD